MYAKITAEGVISEIPNETSFSEMQEIVGGYIESVSSRRGRGITAYVNEEPRGRLAPNLLASTIMGVPLVGDVVIVGAFDGKNEVDLELTEDDWAFIRSVSV